MDDQQSEIERLRQGLWNCARYAGADLDGNETPRSLASDIVAFAVETVKEQRHDYDELLDQMQFGKTAEERARLERAVIETALADRAAETGAYASISEMGDAMIKTRAQFRQAVDALVEFQKSSVSPDGSLDDSINNANRNVKA